MNWLNKCVWVEEVGKSWAPANSGAVDRMIKRNPRRRPGRNRQREEASAHSGSSNTTVSSGCWRKATGTLYSCGITYLMVIFLLSHLVLLKVTEPVNGHQESTHCCVFGKAGAGVFQEGKGHYTSGPGTADRKNCVQPLGPAREGFFAPLIRGSVSVLKGSEVWRKQVEERMRAEVLEKI